MDSYRSRDSRETIELLSKWQSTGSLAHISFYSHCGTESKSRKASKRNRKLVAHLIAGLLFHLPLVFFPLFFFSSLREVG